jgi:molecular chaperone DnaJ
MATTESDYYDLLGVSRNASDAEIKSAFRALARELHPDVSTAPDASARFRDVAEAYEVLSDPARRATYDRFGKAGLRRGGFESAFTDFGSIADVFASFFGEDLFGGASAQRERAQRGGDVQTVVEIELEDAFTGTSLTAPVEVAVPCERCDARGAEPGTGARTCSTCGGAGVVRSVSQNIFGQFVQQRSCPDCAGVGEALEQPCRDCRGDGRVLTRSSVELEVPAGIHDGQRIRVRGAGHAGVLGGPPGDVYVTVRVRGLAGVERNGDDLVVRTSVTITGAALGTTVSVPTPEGPFEVELAPGVQPGSVHTVRGRGLPSLESGRRGDLLVLVGVRVPTNLTGEQRAELLRLEGELGESAYGRGDDDDGFIGKLKNAFR